MGGQGGGGGWGTGAAGSGAGPVTRGEDEGDDGDVSLTCTAEPLLTVDSWHSATRCSVFLLPAPDCHNGCRYVLMPSGVARLWRGVPVRARRS